MLCSTLPITALLSVSYAPKTAHRMFKTKKVARCKMHSLLPCVPFSIWSKMHRERLLKQMCSLRTKEGDSVCLLEMQVMCLIAAEDVDG